MVCSIIELESSQTAEKFLKLLMSCSPGLCKDGTRKNSSVPKRQSISGVDEEIVVVGVSSRWGHCSSSGGGWQCSGWPVVLYL